MLSYSNLFGDILSDLGPACTGTIGITPSANINPERKFESLFEPVHGSGFGHLWSEYRKSNWYDLEWSDDVDHLGEGAAVTDIMTAIEGW